METCDCEKAYFKSEIGTLKIRCCLNGVHSLCILPHDIHKEGKSKILNLETENRKNATGTVIDWLKSYFAASIEDIKHLPPVCPSIFSDKGDFTVRVWKTLMAKVGFGETISYGQLATLSGNNAASRAVGNAMKNNDIPLIIPCHRVIKSNGNIGNYSGGKGVTVKEWLLEHEKC